MRRGLTTGILAVALLLVGCGRETERKLEATQQQLTITSNDLASANAEIAQVKTQMEQKVGELQQTISKLTAEKADTEKKMMSVKGALDASQQQVTVLEKEKAALSSEIGDVRQNLADLEKTHATTVAHLQAMREEFVRLTDAKAVLEAKLHDLKALKDQIRVVKQEMHERKVAEWKRLDRAESAMGNHGYLLKDGAWVVARAPGKYPLNQEIRLAE